MSTVSILSILVYPQSGYLLVYNMGLSLVHCNYLSLGSLQIPMCRNDHITRSLFFQLNNAHKSAIHAIVTTGQSHRFHSANVFDLVIVHLLDLGHLTITVSHILK